MARYTPEPKLVRKEDQKLNLGWASTDPKDWPMLSMSTLEKPPAKSLWATYRNYDIWPTAAIDSFNRKVWQFICRQCGWGIEMLQQQCVSLEVENYDGRLGQYLDLTNSNDLGDYLDYLWEYEHNDDCPLEMVVGTLHFEYLGMSNEYSWYCDECDLFGRLKADGIATNPSMLMSILTSEARDHARSAGHDVDIPNPEKSTSANTKLAQPKKGKVSDEVYALIASPTIAKEDLDLMSQVAFNRTALIEKLNSVKATLTETINVNPAVTQANEYFASAQALLAEGKFSEAQQALTKANRAIENAQYDTTRANAETRIANITSMASSLELVAGDTVELELASVQRLINGD